MKGEEKMPADQNLERLMNEYGDAILRMCFLYLKDYQLAEDGVYFERKGFHGDDEGNCGDDEVKSESCPALF